MSVVKGNAIVGQSGGPTTVINQSLVGVIEAIAGVPEIGHLFGARHGVKGILGEQFVDLKGISKDTLSAVANTPSAALGSVRKKPTREECLQMFEVMKRHDVRYFFYIGGNDSAETANIVNTMAQEADYELRCFHVPKTIDNDLKVTDHCPGFGSAAKFVASAVRGDDLDNRSLPGIKIDVVMGRHAGFLTAAAALARVRDDDGPHLIYLPERPVTREQIRDDVAAVYQRLGRCLAVVSEGVVDAASPNGQPLGESIKHEIAHLIELADKGGAGVPQEAFNVVRLIGGVECDAHGNIQLSGSGVLGDWLAGYIKKELGGKLRVRADTFGYLQRSFMGFVSEIDAHEGRMVGRKAVQFALGSDSDGSVVMIRQPGCDYSIEYSRTCLANVAKETKSLSDACIAPSGHDVTQAFLDYARPLVGPLAPAGWLV